MRESKTLAQYLIDTGCRQNQLPGSVVTLLIDVARACKAISGMVRQGALAGVLGKVGAENVQGEEQAKLDVMSDRIFERAAEAGLHVRGVASEERDRPICFGDDIQRGDYLLLYDPLDGSSNIDVNVSVGSIFSILRMPDPEVTPVESDFLQPGNRQVAAGYAIYGPSTMLVLTIGGGVVGFTLDPIMGDFILTHPHITVPTSTKEFAVNASNSRFWEPPVQRYVNECLEGVEGPRGKDFNMRWIASMVAEAHRILMRGGVFLYPRDNRQPSRAGRLRLMYEANPIAMVMEQAGALASTGTGRILDIEPEELHQRVPLIFGSREEVERLEMLHREPTDGGTDSTPLFQSRGLFRAA